MKASRTEGHRFHGSDMGSITGAGPAGYLKINSTQEGFLPAEETLAEMEPPVVGTGEVDVRCHLGRTESYRDWCSQRRAFCGICANTPEKESHTGQGAPVELVCSFVHSFIYSFIHSFLSKIYTMAVCSSQYLGHTQDTAVTDTCPQRAEGWQAVL